MNGNTQTLPTRLREEPVFTNVYEKRAKFTLTPLAIDIYTATLITAHSVIPANAGIQEGTGFRVKPGVTNRKGLMSVCIVWP